MTAVKHGAIGSDFPKFKVALVYDRAQKNSRALRKRPNKTPPPIPVGRGINLFLFLMRQRHCRGRILFQGVLQDCCSRGEKSKTPGKRGSGAILRDEPSSPTSTGNQSGRRRGGSRNLPKQMFPRRNGGTGDENSTILHCIHIHLLVSSVGTIPADLTSLSLPLI